MPLTTTSIYLNSTNPAADAGCRNAKFQTDNGNPLQSITGELPNAHSLVKKTANYAARSLDCGFMLVFSSASAIAYTLLATPPTILGDATLWRVWVKNVGAGTLTINLNGTTIDGSATNPTLTTGQFIGIWTDGTNYYGTGVLSGGGGGGTPGGSSGQVQYNNAGAFGGASGATIDGSGNLLVTTQSPGDTSTKAASDAFVAAAITAAALTNGNLACVIDGGGSVPSTGSRGYVQAPFSGVITGWTMLANVRGSVQITVKKSTYSGFPSTTSIVASAPPNLSSAQNNTSTTLTGWTTSVTLGDVYEFNLDSVTTITRVILQLQITRSS